MSKTVQLRHFNTPYPNPYDFGNWRACPGVDKSRELEDIAREAAQDRKTYSNRLVYCSQTDLAWVVCLHKAGVLDQETAATLLVGLQTLLESGEYGMGGENSLIPVLDNDEDLASLINLGRTMQEPMSRLQMRDMTIDFFGYFHDFMETLLDFAEKHVDAIMPGHTHASQANPITLANYALSLYDNMDRGLEQMELSYKLVNKNSGGCGATSGTVWPVDREMMTRLLGMDELLEVTYDCEASQDHTLHLMFSVASIAATLSKLTMDIEIWGLEEIGMVTMDPRHAGVSSMMPQKCHNGEITEVLRDIICDILGDAASGLMRTKGEPHGDVLAMYFFPEKGMETLIRGKEVVRRSGVMLRNLHTRPETMLRLVKEGYSCMTEVVVHLVRELGYGGRRSHRICANLVRIARERGIKAPDLTGELLDEAARQCEEEPPNLTSEVLRKCLDPVAFIHAPNNIGGPAPSETQRMVRKRREGLTEARKRQQKRIQRIDQGRGLLQQEIDVICGQKS
ncbi:MAG: lyase family protein [Kiritimatiellae bacterium]|jgi:argininosuccinate lyase|nr:lyase family protein [Kiritimatiellia bacterium]